MYELINWKIMCERALWTAVCLQAAFLMPYVVLVPGERTNVFTSLLTLLPLLQFAAGRLLSRSEAALPLRSALSWFALAAGLVVSAALSSEPIPALWRALSFFAPAAGGLVCAYGLRRSSGAVDFLFHLLTLCFAGLAGAHLLFGAMPSFMGLHHHALAGVLILLAAGPIRMAGSPGGLQRTVGVALLLLGALVCFKAGSRFVILLPFALIPAYIVFKSLSLKRVLLCVLASAIVAWAFFASYPEKLLRVQNYESTYYRVEAFPATWEILKRHGLLGVGIRTPRKPFLELYQPVSGMATKEEFEATLERNVTWDNQYLSLLCGIGVPLSLVYFLLTGRLLGGYLRRAWRQELDHATERAITFALLASVIHFTVHDGLFYPQISWFFHLLLGVGTYYLPGAVPQFASAKRTVEKGGPSALHMDVPQFRASN